MREKRCGAEHVTMRETCRSLPLSSTFRKRCCHFGEALEWHGPAQRTLQDSACRYCCFPLVLLALRAK